MSNILPKPKPIRKPITDVDLLRFVDAVIFGEQLAKLTPHELAEARKSQPYQMLLRIGSTMYRAGEQGLRPRPALMVVDRATESARSIMAQHQEPKTATEYVTAPKAEAMPVDDEQPTPAEV